MRRLSYFLIPSLAPGGGTRLFNTITKQAYEFQCSFIELIHFAKSDSAVEASFLRHGLLIDSESYTQSANSLLVQRKLNSQKVLSITFTVTTKCTGDCVYCFQRHLERSNSSVDVIDEFLVKLRKTLADTALRSVYVLIMGGEPMICFDLVERLVSGIVGVCSAAGVEHSIIMTANGVLAPEQKLRRLAESGLTDIQVTFDGNRKVHNFFRPNSYDQVLANLKLMTKYFSVAIKYNISRDSCRSKVFSEFLSDFMAQNINSTRYLLEFEPLAPSLSQFELPSELFFAPGDSDMAKAIMQLVRQCLAHGVNASLGPAIRSPCVGTSDNSIMIQPDGSVQACLMAYDYPGFRIGSLGTLNSLCVCKDEVRKRVLKAVSTFCARNECPFLAFCETGCMLLKDMAEKTDSVLVCRRDYFESFFPDITDLILERRKATS